MHSWQNEMHIEKLKHLDSFKRLELLLAAPWATPTYATFVLIKLPACLIYRWSTYEPIDKYPLQPVTVIWSSNIPSKFKLWKTTHCLLCFKQAEHAFREAILFHSVPGFFSFFKISLLVYVGDINKLFCEINILWTAFRQTSGQS